MLHRFCVLMVFAASGCQTVDEMRQRPADFVGRYSVPWDDMANCLITKWTGNALVDVVPQIHQRKQSAAITLTLKTSGIVAGDYQIRTLSESSIEVEWRWYSGKGQMGINEADRCGRSA